MEAGTQGEGYEIWRNVGLGIAVAAIRGVAGLGGRMRACGGIGADGSHGSRILEAYRHFSVTLKHLRRIMAATFTKIGDFPLDAGLGPPCPSECDFRIYIVKPENTQERCLGHRNTAL